MRLKETAQHQEIELVMHGYRYFARMIKCDKELIDPIFFLGGAFQTMDSWIKFVEFFKDKTTLILVDLPGGGNSDVLPEEYGFDFMVESVDKVLNHYTIPKVNLLSASYGTPIAYEYAKRHPHRVSHLLLAGIMREFPDDLVSDVIPTFALLRENRMDEFASVIINGMLCVDPLKEINKRNFVLKLFRKQLMNLNSDQIDRYIGNTRRLFRHSPLNTDHSPGMPALVFTGEYDVFTKPAYCKEIAATFKNAAYTTIKNSDHLFHLEQIDTVLQLCCSFFFDESLEDIPGCNEVEYFGGKSSSATP